MKRYLIVLAVALLALSVGASQAVAAPTAVAAKKCKKKAKKKCKKKKHAPQNTPGAQGPPSTGSPGTPGTPGTPATTKVTALDGNPFEATNDSVSLTPDGVEFGPYTDGGSTGGSVLFTGLNGMTLGDVQSLVYQARYTSDGDTGGVGVPYLRVFLNGDAVDAIFSPNSQTDPDVAEGPFHTWVATAGVWRYDDDCGDGFLDSTSTDGSGCTGTGTASPYGVNGAPFSEVQGDHASDVVSGIYISVGFTAGTNLAALLREWQINDTHYSFSS
jgi:hypothetical protein